MPVTAKLSRALYERLGDAVADELVDWFNMVDATYRADLRELNELNFARFDAKLEQRIGELRAAMHAGFARTDARVDKLDARMDQIKTELDAGLAQIKMELHARMAKLETRLTQRLFAFWVAQAAATAGLVFAVVKLAH